jgi:AcrR family transcriptional regulator
MTRTLRRAVSDEDKARRRAQILDAATSLFATRGFHATTMADVARGADLSYGVLYWYFASKDELFHALMAHEEERLRLRIREAVIEASGADEAGVLRAAVRATFAFFSEDTSAARLLFHEPSALGEGFERHLSGILERFIDDLEALVVSAQQRGEVRPAPPRMVAVTCAGLIGQIALRRTRTDDGLDPSAAADFVVDVLLDGLRPRTAPPRSRAPKEGSP